MRDKFLDWLDNSNRMWIAVLVMCILMLIGISSKAQSKDEVYKYIVEIGVHSPEIVYRQVLLETRHLECTNCTREYNNLLGWRYNHRNLRFDDWKESIDYYKGWQERRGYDGKEDYYEFLKRKWGVADMDEYCNKLKSIRI